MPKKSPMAVTRCRNAEFRWGERTYIMGICNLSPDSFSGDGLGADIEAILAQAKRQLADGADIIDIGGESTRPAATPISMEEELQMVIPAIERLAHELPAPLSIDTYRAAVASQAIKAGANMINDTWGLKRDPGLAQVAAEAGVPIVLMSNQRDMPLNEEADIIAGVISDLKQSIKLALEAGITENNIIIDPGIGFGKTVEQNLETLKRLSELKALNLPILLGTSRKFMRDRPFDQRLEATAATIAIGIAHGADIVRVHEVEPMVQVCRMSDSLMRRK